MTDLGPIIQGGALALLACVLFWLGRIARESIRSNQRSGAEREAKLHALISEAHKDSSEARREAMAQRTAEDEARREMFERTIQASTSVMQHVASTNENLTRSLDELASKLADRPCLETARYEHPDRRRLG